MQMVILRLRRRSGRQPKESIIIVCDFTYVGIDWVNVCLGHVKEKKFIYSK